MFAVLSEMFGYAFLVRAFFVGILVSICAALLGVSLVLKRYSMIGDGLSHVGFGSLAVATALNAAPLTVSIPLTLAAAFLLLRLSENSKINGDAAIALISTGSLAVGVVIISQTTGMNTDVCNYLFGSILAMNKNDVYLSIALSAAVLVLFVLFYNKLFAVTFDETFARATGVKAGMYNMLTAFLTAITIVLGMRMMGALLISSLIIFPALTSMRLFKKFKSVTTCSAAISILCFCLGLTLSYLYATPTGASIVMMNIFAFLLFWGIAFLQQGLRKNPAGGRIVTGLGALVICILISGCGAATSVKRNNAGTLSVNLPGYSAAAERGAVQGAEPQDGAEAPKQDPLQASAGAGDGAVSPDAAVLGTGAGSSEVIEIKEKMFIAQTNDVYLNAEDYLGKTIRLEGLFKSEQYYTDNGASGNVYCFVLRYGPGCCGNDGNAGFEVAWDDHGGLTYPQQDDWVEAVGTLKTYTEDDYPYLYIALSSLRVLDERGAEFVTQ
jgi:zinc transport system permease protein